MKKKILLGLATGLLALATAPSAFAALDTVTLPDGFSGPLSGGARSFTVIAPKAGTAQLTFDLIGYFTVEGTSVDSTDTFTLALNGRQLFAGGFDMGGGGSLFIDNQDPGVSILSSVSNGPGLGGLTQFSVTHDLLLGRNTYLLDYGQMDDNEGWGVANAKIQNTATPEPATMLLVASGLAGLVATRRKKNG